MKSLVHRSTWRERFVVAFVAGFTSLGFTVVNFLNYNNYPLLRPELGYLYVGLGLICAGMATLYSGQRLWGRAFLEALLIAAVVDLNFNSLWQTGGAFVASFAFVIGTRKSLLSFAAVMSSVMLILAILGSGAAPGLIETTPGRDGQRATAEARRPAIVHLIFDEHIGFEGFPDGNLAASEIRADLRDFYASRGFAMFGRAYSEHDLSANSIPQILNLGDAPPVQKDAKRFVSVGPSRYLNVLRQRGYTIRLYQNRGYLDLCGALPTATCTSYSDVFAVVDSSLSRTDRAQILSFKLLALSDVLRAIDARVIPVVGRLFSPQVINSPVERMGWTNPVASLAMMDRLSDELRHARAGEAYVAHLLVPHVPTVVDRDCAVLPFKQWDRRVQRIPAEQRERDYFEQVRCTMKKTDHLLRSLAQSPAGANSIVILHGDHGSRLWQTLSQNVQGRHRSNEDYVAGFSTMFAVRLPGFESTYVTAPASVANLLSQLTESDFRELPRPSPGPPMVYLADSEWRPTKRVPLPESWWKDSPPIQPHSK